jgi:hypothetical protein
MILDRARRGAGEFMGALAAQSSATKTAA